MLIHSLIEHAKKHGLVGAYRIRNITYRIQLGGENVTLIEKEEEVELPYLRDRKTGTGLDPYPLYDRTDYSVGVPCKDKALRVGQVKSFLEHARAVVNAAGDHEAACLLENVREEDLTSLIGKVEPDKWAALAIGDGLIAHRPQVRAYFEKSFRQSMGDKEGPDTCLVTGQRCRATLVHERISGVPRTGAGVPLISFKASTARDNEQLDQGHNFPMSRDAVTSYAASLRDLLVNNSARIGDDNTFGVCVICWGPEGAEAIPRVIEPYGTVENRREAWAKIEALQDNEDVVHILFVKGSKGRIAVLSYDVLLVSSVSRSLVRFRDTFNRPPIGLEEAPSVLGAISRTAPQDLPIIDTMLVVNIVRSILFGKDLPETLVPKLSQHLEPKGKDTYYHMLVRLKWFEYCNLLERGRPPLLRVGRYNPNGVQMSTEPDIGQYIATKWNNPFYSLGRLVSVVDHIRSKAHSPRRVPSNAEEYRRRIITNPAAGLDKLISEIGLYRENYKEKLRGREWLQTASELLTHISPGTLTPRPLMADQRCNLGLGYSHQDAYAWARIKYYSRKKADKQVT